MARKCVKNYKGVNKRLKGTVSGKSSQKKKLSLEPLSEFSLFIPYKHTVTVTYFYISIGIAVSK